MQASVQSRVRIQFASNATPKKRISSLNHDNPSIQGMDYEWQQILLGHSKLLSNYQCRAKQSNSWYWVLLLIVSLILKWVSKEEQFDDKEVTRWESVVAEEWKTWIGCTLMTALSSSHIVWKCAFLFLLYIFCWDSRIWRNFWTCNIVSCVISYASNPNQMKLLRLGCGYKYGTWKASWYFTRWSISQPVLAAGTVLDNSSRCKFLSTKESWLQWYFHHWLPSSLQAHIRNPFNWIQTGDAAYFFSALEIITSPTPTSIHTTITNEHRSLQICWLEWFPLWGRLLTSFSAPRCIRFSSVLVFRSMLTSKLNAWGSAQNGNEWESRLQKEGKGRLQQNLLETKGKQAKLRESALHGQEM